MITGASLPAGARRRPQVAELGTFWPVRVRVAVFCRIARGTKADSDRKLARGLGVGESRDAGPTNR